MPVQCGTWVQLWRLSMFCNPGQPHGWYCTILCSSKQKPGWMWMPLSLWGDCGVPEADEVTAAATTTWNTRPWVSHPPWPSTRLLWKQYILRLPDAIHTSLSLGPFSVQHSCWWIEQLWRYLLRSVPFLTFSSTDLALFPEYILSYRDTW